jgi:hypothetical protein
MGGGLRDGVNVAAGMGGTPCHYGDGLPPSYHSELCAEQKNMKIFKGLSNSKIMVFIVKKLKNVSVGLTL